MTTDNKVDRQKNIEAFKRAVGTPTADGPWTYVENSPKPGTSDIKNIAVKVPMRNAGLERDPDRKIEVPIPRGDLSVKEIFAGLSGVNPQVLKAQPKGESHAYYAELGQHERDHLKESLSTAIDGGLGDEIRADLGARNRDNPEAEDAIRYTRYLSAMLKPDHATGPALDDGEWSDTKRNNSAAMFSSAQTLRHTVVADLMSKGTLPKADDFQALHYDHPEKVYDSVKSLRDGGAFKDIEGSRGDYIRQYVDQYIEASEKWIKGAEPAKAPNSATPTRKHYPTPGES